MLGNNPYADQLLFEQGQAAGLLVKSAGDAVSTYALKGRLVRSASGWGLLEIPNALVRGLFAALHEPGVELPPTKSGQLRAHVSVIRPEELKAIGDKVTEFGHYFSFQIGPLKTVEPMGWKDMSRVWFVSVISPELMTLRKSYGLPALPQKNGETLPFHCSVAVRRKGVLTTRPVTKAASECDCKGGCRECMPDEFCPNPKCDGRLERGDNGNCNRCGCPWPAKTAEDDTNDDGTGNTDIDDLGPGRQAVAGGTKTAAGTLAGVLCVRGDRDAAGVGDRARVGGTQAGRIVVGSTRIADSDLESHLARILGLSGNWATNPEQCRDEADRHRLAKSAAANAQDPEYLAETEKIKANREKPENQKPHDFEAAEWTHPNGHPRCIHCGCEERSSDGDADGMTNGKPSQCEGYKPNRNKGQRASAESTRQWRIAKHDRRVANAHNPKIRAFGRANGIDIESILLPVPKHAHVLSLLGLDKVAERERASKRTLTLEPFEIKIEYEKGDTRKGTSADGKAWERTMADAYGRIHGTKGADGDSIDCYVGGKPTTKGDVYVVNQVDPDTGKLDEHKAMIGFGSEAAAKSAYLRNYPAGWKGLGSIKTMTWDDFADWAQSGKTQKAAAAQCFKPSSLAYGGMPAQMIPASSTFPGGRLSPLPTLQGGAGADVVFHGPTQAPAKLAAHVLELLGVEKQAGGFGEIVSKVLGTAGRTGKFVAGVPAGEAFAPTLGAGMRNTARAAFKPRYPGLDRPAGVAALARPLDRTRAAMGTGLRASNAAAMGLSGAGIGYGALVNYPKRVAQTVGNVAGFPTTNDYDTARQNAIAAAPGVYGELGKQVVGLGDQSAASKLTTDVVKDVAVPTIRNDIYTARQNNPGWYGMVDTMRSTTPVGLATTLGIRALGSSQPPDVAGAIAKHAPKYAPEIAANPEASAKSPFVRAFNQVAPSDMLARSYPRVAGAGLGYHAGVLSRDDALQMGGIRTKQFGPTFGQLGKAISTSALQGSSPVPPEPPAPPAQPATPKPTPSIQPTIQTPQTQTQPWSPTWQQTALGLGAAGAVGIGAGAYTAYRRKRRREDEARRAQQVAQSSR